ncbi:MAG TPA: choice-of-anchor D domain-containing protein, partial [Acetobacteraceae bacterium]|nr:choice-of-anchor D domain-containing protein [Acetobacteraceae bacterium]
TGAAYNLANPVVTPGTVALGNFHVHDTVTQQGITIANQTISNANYQEGLNASFGSVGSLITTNGGAITNMAAGSSDSTSLKVGVNTNTAGAISQTATIALTSNGTIDGLANTALTAQPVTVTAGIYNLASSSTISPVSIITRVGAGGGSVSQALSVQNTAPTGAYSEGLDSSPGSYTSGGGNLTPTVTGTITNLPAGSTDSSNLKATISTATSGTFTGSVPINQASNGATTSGLGISSLGSQTVDLSGKVYQTAVASVTPAVSFGIVHVGDTVSPQTITVTNTASGALVDSIVGSMTAGPAPFAVVGGGTLGSGVTAGNNSGSALQVGLNTSTAGTYTGNANLTLSSHDSDLADVALSTSPVSLSGTVNNYAEVGLAGATKGSLTGGGSAYTLNLGTLTQGSNGGSIAAALAALNAALGPADALTLNSGDYSVISGGGEFGVTLNQVTDLAAGDSQDNALDVSLDTNDIGTFDEVITFDGIGSNASGYNSNVNVLDPTLTIEATVTAGGSGPPPTGVPEPSSWLVLLSALAGLGGMRRLRNRGQPRVGQPGVD